METIKFTNQSGNEISENLIGSLEYYHRMFYKHAIPVRKEKHTD